MTEDERSRGTIAPLPIRSWNLPSGPPWMRYSTEECPWQCPVVSFHTLGPQPLGDTFHWEHWLVGPLIHSLHFPCHFPDTERNKEMFITVNPIPLISPSYRDSLIRSLPFMRSQASHSTTIYELSQDLLTSHKRGKYE